MAVSADALAASLQIKISTTTRSLAASPALIRFAVRGLRGGAVHHCRVHRRGRRGRHPVLRLPDGHLLGRWLRVLPGLFPSRVRLKTIPFGTSANSYFLCAKQSISHSAWLARTTTPRALPSARRASATTTRPRAPRSASRAPAATPPRPGPRTASTALATPTPWALRSTTPPTCPSTTPTSTPTPTRTTSPTTTSTRPSTTTSRTSPTRRRAARLATPHPAPTPTPPRPSATRSASTSGAAPGAKRASAEKHVHPFPSCAGRQCRAHARFVCGRCRVITTVFL